MLQVPRLHIGDRTPATPRITSVSTSKLPPATLLPSSATIELAVTLGPIVSPLNCTPNVLDVRLGGFGNRLDVASAVRKHFWRDGEDGQRENERESEKERLDGMRPTLTSLVYV